MISRVSRLPVLLLLLPLAFVTGCIFSPERKPAKKIIPVIYSPPTSPRAVLGNLVAAYKDRDSVETAKVYDDSYSGSGATDPSAPSPPPEFFKKDEIRHVGRLKLDPNIVSVFLDLGPQNAWEELDGSSLNPGWKIIDITSQTVRIEDIGRLTTWESHNRVIEYVFKPTRVEGAPASEDTTWTVVKWTEIAN